MDNCLFHICFNKQDFETFITILRLLRQKHKKCIMFYDKKRVISITSIHPKYYRIEYNAGRFERIIKKSYDLKYEELIPYEDIEIEFDISWLLSSYRKMKLSEEVDIKYFADGWGVAWASISDKTQSFEYFC